MKPLNGKYALVQFCPEPQRLEFLNVGLLLIIPDAAGYSRVDFIDDPSRLERIFGKIPDRYFSAVLSSLRFRIEKGLRKGAHWDIDEFIDRRANDIKITRLMSVLIDGDPDKEFDRLFATLVGASITTPRRTRARKKLKGLFADFGVSHLLEKPETIELDGYDISISAPFAYQNGHYNLIDSIQVTDNVPQTLREAGKKALEGDLLWSENSLFGARLVVVADFADRSNGLYSAIKDHFDRTNVKLFRFDEADELIYDIRAHSPRLRRQHL